MKRFITLALVVAFLVALPASHLLIGKGKPDKEEVLICHFAGKRQVRGGHGFIKIVPLGSLPRHLGHGDCENPVMVDDYSARCDCP